MRKNKRAFTLIELIAVLVIMAILALIVTPLVMNIIRKARVAADKRSIDAYGRSIELAIAGYLLDNGKFPTDVSQLTIEYSGNQVVCETTQLNSDSSVYLTGCTVGGRTVDYAYGSDKTPPAPTYTAYTVGNQVTYNNVNYYVIENSDTTQSTVKLLKAEPLSAQEISDYKPSDAQTYSSNGYTGMQYHSSSNAYEGSYIKTTVDAWKAAKAPAATEARLITLDELKNNLGYQVQQECTGSCYQVGRKTDDTPSWVYNSNYYYWTMSPHSDSASRVWNVSSDGSPGYGGVDDIYSVVRPVIILSKSLISA